MYIVLFDICIKFDTMNNCFSNDWSPFYALQILQESTKYWRNRNHIIIIQFTVVNIGQVVQRNCLLQHAALFKYKF